MKNPIVVFNASLIISLGVGVKLSQLLGDKLLDGNFFIGFGFLFLIIFLLIDKFILKEI